MSARFTAENNLFPFVWNSPTVQFILSTWVIFSEETEIYPKIETNHKKRARHCIQFEIGTETVSILKINKISQSSEQIVVDLSEWREHLNPNFHVLDYDLVLKVENWIPCGVYFPSRYLPRKFGRYSILLVTDHYPPHYQRFYSSQQQNHSFYSRSNRDFSCDVVEAEL